MFFTSAIFDQKRGSSTSPARDVETAKEKADTSASANQETKDKS
jgi:hypothetical protein